MNQSVARSDIEDRVAQQVFLERLALVTDGSVYTLSRLMELFGCSKSMATEFLRMCNIYPFVHLHKKRLKTGETQVTFLPDHAHDSHAMILALAEEIINDPNASGRAQSAAQRIKVLLGA